MSKLLLARLNAKELIETMEVFQKVKLVDVVTPLTINITDDKIEFSIKSSVLNIVKILYGFKVAKEKIEEILIIPIKELEQMIKSLKFYDDTISFLMEEETLYLSDDKRIFKVNTDNEYLKNVNETQNKLKEENEVGNSIVIKNQKDFVKALENHVRFACESEIRPLLQGVLFTDDYIISTDSYMALRTKMSQFVDGYFEIEDSVISSPLIKVLLSTKQEIVMVTQYKNSVKFIAKKMEFTFIKVSGTYPNLNTIYQTEKESKVSYNKAEFEKANNFIKTFVSKTDSNSIPMILEENLLSVLGKGSIELSKKDITMGKIDNLRVGINPYRVDTCLKVLNTEKFTMEVDNTRNYKKPLFLQDENQNCEIILFPFNLND